MLSKKKMLIIDRNPTSFLYDFEELITTGMAVCQQVTKLVEQRIEYRDVAVVLVWLLNILDVDWLEEIFVRTRALDCPSR